MQKIIKTKNYNYIPLSILAVVAILAFLEKMGLIIV